MRLLFRTTETMNAEMTARIRDRGFPDFQPSFTGVLVHIDTEGTRIGVIAARMHVTRQAASQAVQAIERHGFLERIGDPEDRRATIVRHTERGRSVLVTAIEVMLAIEVEYAGILGAEGFGRLRDLLRQLAEATDPGGQLQR